MSAFIFRSYTFNEETRTAHFRYGFESGESFEETVTFQVDENYDKALLDKALFLSFVLTGVSYYKAFPSRDAVLPSAIDEWQAGFFNTVYQEGLGQFAFENNLTRDDLAWFSGTGTQESAVAYSGAGTLSLQSGGKDSLLVASLLDEFTPWYVANGEYHPELLNTLGSEQLVISRRTVDVPALLKAKEQGGLNGHVPITYILSGFALIQAILLNKQNVLLAIAHEGEEPDAYIADLAVTHQWSKTWKAEQALAEYVTRYISPDLHIGSPLRGYSELRVAELFVEHSWKTYGHVFSSCNVANYQQGNDNTSLKWCGNCPKCANSYLLFAPFVASSELQSLFGGRDLFTSNTLQETFKGLLGIDGVAKPFECIGEIDELRRAYHMSQKREGYASLPFDVPESTFDYLQNYPSQDWATAMLQ